MHSRVVSSTAVTAAQPSALHLKRCGFLRPLRDFKEKWRRETWIRGSSWLPWKHRSAPPLPTRSFSLFPLLSVCYICFPTEEGLPRGDPRVWDWCSALCPLLSQNAGWVSPSSDRKQFVRANECGRQRHGKEDVMHMFTRVKSDCITYYWSLFHIKASRHYNTEG